MGALGRRGQEGHKNKAGRGHLGSRRPVFGPYGRGNFPGHDVFAFYARMVKDGWLQVKMDSYACVGVQGHEGNQKQEKKRVKWSRTTCFGMHGHGGK